MRNNDKEVLYGILNERNIREVQFGCDKRFPTWYGSTVYFSSNTRQISYKETERGSPKRTPLDQYWLDTLYICEYCFKYTDTEHDLSKHTMYCAFKNKAPGRIKYLGREYVIRRIKGSKHQLFCQCLCLFTKLFLDNKSMYFKVDHYEFYIVCKVGSTKPMGFFSKDLLSYNRNNLACVLIFPPYQRKQLGTLLIEFSYKLSMAEGLVSGPESPLSPFGLISYIRFWSRRICWELIDGELSDLSLVTLNDISEVTGFRINDIITTLKYLDCISPSGGLLLSTMKDKVTSMHGKISDNMIQVDELLIEP